jgi:hypothetical protein
VTRAEFARAYAASTEHFDRLACEVAPDRLDAKEPGGWSARQVIHHVADSEAQSYARLRRLVAEPQGSIIQGYDEAAWAQCQTLGYEDLPVNHALQVFRAVRAASLDVIERLTDDDLERVGHHTESGAYSVRLWLETYIAHPLDHAEQLQRAIAVDR